jgi:hypothetical protein
MDDLRNDSCLRHFKCRSTTYTPQHACLNRAIHMPQPTQVNVECDAKQFGDEVSFNKWYYVGTSPRLTLYDKISARRRIQDYMADNY